MWSGDIDVKIDEPVDTSVGMFNRDKYRMVSAVYNVCSNIGLLHFLKWILVTMSQFIVHCTVGCFLFLTCHLEYMYMYKHIPPSV